MTNGIPPRHADAAVPVWAGLALSQPRVMGILNVTPDSFSDGGRHFAADTAIRAATARRGVGTAVPVATTADAGGRPAATCASPC